MYQISSSIFFFKIKRSPRIIIVKTIYSLLYIHIVTADVMLLYGFKRRNDNKENAIHVSYPSRCI